MQSEADLTPRQRRMIGKLAAVQSSAQKPVCNKFCDRPTMPRNRTFGHKYSTLLACVIEGLALADSAMREYRSDAEFAREFLKISLNLTENRVHFGFSAIMLYVRFGKCGKPDRRFPRRNLCQFHVYRQHRGGRACPAKLNRMPVLADPGNTRFHVFWPSDMVQ